MKKRFFAALLCLCMIFALLPAGALAEGFTLPEAVDGVITLTTKLDIKDESDLIIDLAGNTLKLTKASGHLTNSKVTIKNGIIDVSGVTDAGNGIICVGGYDSVPSILTLDNVTLKGDNISSGAGTLFVYGGSTLNIINGSEVEISNENSTQAYVIYCNVNNGGLVGTVNITESTVTATNGNSGILNGDINITDSTITFTGMQGNGINSGTGTLDLTASGSQITITDCGGRGLTVDGDSTMLFEDGTKVEVKDCDEGDVASKATATENSSITATGSAYIRYNTSELKAQITLVSNYHEPVVEVPDDSQFTTCQACGHHDWIETVEGYACTTCGHLIITLPKANVKLTGLYQPAAAPAAAPAARTNPQTGIY